MLEYLAIPVYQRALFAIFIAGIMLAEVGTLMVLENFTFAAAGITHVAFAGVTLFLLLGLQPLVGAFVFAILSAILMWYFSEHREVHLDTAMGILFAFFMGLAILFMGLSKGYSGEAISYLFGSVLTVGPTDIYLLVLAFVLVQIFLLVYHKDLFLILLNRELARAGGVDIKMISLLFLILLAIVLTLTMKILGALLVLGMAVMPAVIGLRVGRSFIKAVVYSGIFGGILGFTGVVVSLLINTPPSATVIIISFLVMGIIVLLKAK